MCGRILVHVLPSSGCAYSIAVGSRSVTNTSLIHSATITYLACTRVVSDRLFPLALKEQDASFAMLWPSMSFPTWW